mgnify:CR=1 FL=1
MVASAAWASGSAAVFYGLCGLGVCSQGVRRQGWPQAQRCCCCGLYATYRARSFSLDRVCANAVEQEKRLAAIKTLASRQNRGARDEEASAEAHELRKDFWRVVHPP